MQQSQSVSSVIVSHNLPPRDDGGLSFLDDDQPNTFKQSSLNNSAIGADSSSSAAPAADIYGNNNSAHEGATTTQISGGAPPPPPPSDIDRAKDKFFAMLESQGFLMAFLLYIVFALLCTGAIDKTASFVLFAFAVRMAIHGVVSLWCWEYSDIVVSVIGITVSAAALPVTESTAAAGIWGYILLVLPWYSEEARRVCGRNIHLWRKRAVQFAGVFAPVATCIWVFLQLHSGIVFHVVTLAICLVYIGSYIVRALDDPNKQQQQNGESGDGNNDNAEQQQQQDSSDNGKGIFGSMPSSIPTSQADVAMGAAAAAGSQALDAAGAYVQDIRDRKKKFEEGLAAKNPQVYQYYLVMARPITSTVCTLLLFLVLVINVATYEPSGFILPNNSTAAPSSSYSSSSSSGVAPTMAPPPTTAIHNDGGGANPSRPFQTEAERQAVYSFHYYVAIGLVSAFLLAGLEASLRVFLPPNVVSPRHLRFALLGFAAIIAFFPASWRVYPAALGLAAVVPWLVWGTSCEDIVRSKYARNKAERREDVQSANDENAAAAAAGFSPRVVVPPTMAATADDDGNNNNNNNNSPTVGPDGDASSTGGGINNEHLIVDFAVPTLIAALLLFLATGAEEKKPANFVFFVALLAHAGMSYFLYQSLRQMLGLATIREQTS